MQGKLWYRCDPEKNIECKKSGCKSNKGSSYPICEYTSKKEYSSDGIAMEVVNDSKTCYMKVVEG